MKILVTNDDGIRAAGLQALVEELQHISEVIVVAPDREQSAVGTAITLRHPLRVQKVIPLITGVETYAVSGTPGDSVIMGLSKLVEPTIDLVISGINHGPNLGDDILISGTVGGALQGYLHGVSAIAVSVNGLDNLYLNTVARFTALLAKAVNAASLKANIFLNVNMPDLPASQIKGIKVTRPSTTGYADTVEEGHDGRQEYYWLKHRKANDYAPRLTDAWAIARRQISITPLHTYLFGKTQPSLNGHLTGLLDELKRSLYGL
jgi:5'-nucleotidase